VPGRDGVVDAGLDCALEERDVSVVRGVSLLLLVEVPHVVEEDNLLFFSDRIFFLVSSVKTLSWGTKSTDMSFGKRLLSVSL